ncbi:MAG: hypothetical protein ABT940_04530 [Alphaproteobacteria bacterium]
MSVARRSLAGALSARVIVRAQAKGPDGPARRLRALIGYDQRRLM